MSYMDFIYNKAASLGLTSGEEEDARARRPLLLLAPLGTAVPDDGMLEYRTFQSAAELLTPVDGVVWLCAPEQLPKVKAVVSNADAFEFRPIVVFGVPSTEYDQSFGDATFGAERWAYTSVISALRESSDLEQLKKESAVLSKHDRERKQVSRADGTVRFHGNDAIRTAEEDDDGTE